ncbi:MAG: YajD family HNH nuclease [Gammaproteobacteria bacterium]
MSSNKSNKLDQVVLEARRAAEKRELGYREQALKLYPWICGRCSREFTRTNLRELTVHHRDHNHDNNPTDGSNWELLCVYCHDNEHQKYEELVRGGGYDQPVREEFEPATSQPFANLREMLKGK